MERSCRTRPLLRHPSHSATSAVWLVSHSIFGSLAICFILKDVFRVALEALELVPFSLILVLGVVDLVVDSVSHGSNHKCLKTRVIVMVIWYVPCHFLAEKGDLRSGHHFVALARETDDLRLVQTLCMVFGL